MNLIFLLLTLVISVSCQTMMYVGGVVGGVLVILILCHFCICFFIFFEICRKKCCKRGRPQDEPVRRERNNNNAPNRNASNANNNSNPPRRQNSSSNIQRDQNRYSDLASLEEDLGSNRGDKLQYSKELFNIDNDKVRLKLRISPAKGQPPNQCNTFMVSIDSEGEYFMKTYAVPVRFFITRNLFTKMEGELKNIKSKGTFPKKPFFIKMNGLSLKEKRKKIAYVAEYCHNGNIRKISRRKIPFKKKLQILFQLAQVLEVLEREKFVYKKLNHKNVLLASNYQVKLNDYRYDDSFKKFFTKDKGEKNELFLYYPPEYFREGDFTHKGDVFSFGIIMYELLTDKFDSFSQYIRQGKTFYGSKIKTDPSFRPKIDSKYGNDEKLAWYISLMKLCWGFDQKTRPSPTIILKIFKKHDIDDGGGDVNKAADPRGSSVGRLNNPSSNRPRVKRSGKRKTRVISVSNLPGGDGVLIPGQDIPQPMLQPKSPKGRKGSTGSVLDEEFLKSDPTAALAIESQISIDKRESGNENLRNREKEELERIEREKEKKRVKEETERRVKEEAERIRKEEKKKRKEERRKRRAERRKRREEAKKSKKDEEDKELFALSESSEEETPNLEAEIKQIDEKNKQDEDTNEVKDIGNEIDVEEEKAEGFIIKSTQDYLKEKQIDDDLIFESGNKEDESAGEVMEIPDDDLIDEVEDSQWEEDIGDLKDDLELEDFNDDDIFNNSGIIFETFNPKKHKLEMPKESDDDEDLFPSTVKDSDEEEPDKEVDSEEDNNQGILFETLRKGPKKSGVSKLKKDNENAYMTDEGIIFETLRTGPPKKKLNKIKDIVDSGEDSEVMFEKIEVKDKRMNKIKDVDDEYMTEDGIIMETLRPTHPHDKLLKGNIDSASADFDQDDGILFDTPIKDKKINVIKDDDPPEGYMTEDGIIMESIFEKRPSKIRKSKVNELKEEDEGYNTEDGILFESLNKK